MLDADLEPADAEEANRRAAEQQARFVTRTKEVREAEDAVQTARDHEQRARSRATLLRSSLDILPAPVGQEADSGTAANERLSPSSK